MHDPSACSHLKDVVSLSRHVVELLVSIKGHSNVYIDSVFAEKLDSVFAEKLVRHISLF